VTASYKIIQSEFVEWARKYEGEKFHALLCDSPYGISFMGKDWDDGGGSAAFQAQVKEWGAAMIPLLYPGALVFMFGGTRTWHRLACGMEDAGFQMFDTLMWIHGQGFPKAQDISKLIDKSNGDERGAVIGKTGRHGGGGSKSIPDYDRFPQSDDVTAPGSEESAPWSGHKTAALKPAWEPILCCRAPDKGKTYAELALEHGSGALNVDAGRIGISKDIPASPSQHIDERCHGKYGAEDGTADGFNPNLGRYPANLAFECTCEKTEIVDAPSGDAAIGKHTHGPRSSGMFGSDGDSGALINPVGGGKAILHTDPNCPAAMLDAQSTETIHGAGYARDGSDNPRIVDAGNIYGLGFDRSTGDMQRFGDSGGASRFFYCAKASRGEREAGLENRPSSEAKDSAYGDGLNSATKIRTDSQVQLGVDRGRIRNNHPTVKPIDLNRWLASLLLPAPVRTRRILVPFAGVASEMIGCLLAGWDEVVGIEQDADYCRIGSARLEHWSSQIRSKVKGESEIENVKAVLEQIQKPLF
jgi:DNA modification methylase